MSAVNPEINPELDRVVFECIQKEPDERYQSVRDISKELKRYKRESSRQRTTRTMAARRFGPGSGPQPVPSSGPDAEGSVTAAPPSRPWRRFLWPGVSLLLAAALGTLALTGTRVEPAAPVAVMRFPVTLSVSSPLVLGAATLAIAPDGRNFVYLAGDPNNPQLFLRPLGSLDATAMAGTEGASDPFFSEDGKWVAFFAAGKLKKISIFGGGTQDVCSVPGFMRGGSWLPSNEILFGHLNRGIFSVPATGGTPTEVTVLDSARGEISHRFPQALPGGKWVLFTVKFNNISSFDDAAIAAENIETHERKELVRGGSYGRYIATGHLMYARGTSLFAIPFDVGRMQISGTPLPVLEGGMLNPYSGTANFEVSRTGILVYTPIGPAGINNVAVAWMDHQGKTTRIIGENRPYDNPRLSPDGSKIAVTLRAANDDIWVYDIARAALSRLTFGGGNSDLAVWTPDGMEIVFAAERGRGIALLRKPWDGSGAPVDLGIGHELSQYAPPSITPDGRKIVFSSKGDLMVKDLQEGGATTRLAETEAFEDAPRLSPDGRILTYASNESGRMELYAVPYPKPGGKWQISTGGPSSPAVWSPDGRELFYAEQGKLMKVDVTTTPRVKFSSPYVVCPLPPAIYSVYGVSTDGKRFLVGIGESSKVVATQVNVVVGWFEELEQKFLSARQ
jgi:serine/threonine-protein kinase